MIQPRDRKRLEDIIFYAEKAMQFLGSLDATSLAPNEEKVFAIIRAVEVVGEAASQVSESLAVEAPQLPLAVAKRMRNLLIHAYREIDIEVVVATVVEDFPLLVCEVSRMLEEPQP